VLLGDIEISNHGAFAVSGDPWKRKNSPRPSENCQQLVGTVGVVPQEYYPRDCSCLYEVWKDSFYLLAAHSDQAHIRSKTGRQFLQNGQHLSVDSHRL
jgi:hypothetical protein